MCVCVFKVRVTPPMDTAWDHAVLLYHAMSLHTVSGCGHISPQQAAKGWFTLPKPLLLATTPVPGSSSQNPYCYGTMCYGPCSSATCCVSCVLCRRSAATSARSRLLIHRLTAADGRLTAANVRTTHNLCGTGHLPTAWCILARFTLWLG